MDKRVEKNNLSVLALRDLLSEIPVQAEKYIEQNEIVKALKSQGALAKLSVESKCIYPSSINTLKRIAETILEGGFQALDELRKSAQSAIERKLHESKRPDKVTKGGLLLKIEQLEIEKQSLREDLLLLTLAFERSLRQGFRYACRADDSIQALCKKEQRELLDIISLKKHSINSNVAKLREDKIETLSTYKGNL